MQQPPPSHWLPGQQGPLAFPHGEHCGIAPGITLAQTAPASRHRGPGSGQHACPLPPQRTHSAGKVWTLHEVPGSVHRCAGTSPGQHACSSLPQPQRPSVHLPYSVAPTRQPWLAATQAPRKQQPPPVHAPSQQGSPGPPHVLQVRTPVGLARQVLPAPQV